MKENFHYSYNDYFCFLTSLGDFYPLNFKVNHMIFHDVIGQHQEQWKPYNPRKVNNRFGLSLTSLDGGLSGVPDLDSLAEYNRIHGTSYDEVDFARTTEVYSKLTDLRDRMAPIESFLGRSHILRMDEGSYFPPHRDGQDLENQCFRLISFLNCNPHTLHLSMDDRLLSFEKGRFYFMNTKRSHSLVSFQDEAYCVVFNVRLSRESVDFIGERTFSR